MKKISFVLVSIVFAGSICFAAETPSSNVAQTSQTSTTATPAATTNFTGKVYSASSSRIVVKDDKGQETTFSIAADAVITDKAGKTTSVDWISRDDTVSIEYAGTGSSQTAKSIKVISTW